MKAQNVNELAEISGMRRDGLYKTFGRHAREYARQYRRKDSTKIRPPCHRLYVGFPQVRT
jgi:hypothetical protein